MNTVLLVLLCNALSCFIISTILFQFMNGKYKKSSRNRYVYIVIETVTVIFTTCINMLNHSILNLVVWGVLTGIIAYALYYEDMDKPLSAGWTMEQYEHQYRQAFAEVAKAADPTWKAGKPIPAGALDGITRESVESGKKSVDIKI